MKHSSGNEELKDRVHSCPHCQLTIDRDLNAAINIKYRAVGYSVLKANPRIRTDRWSWIEARAVCVASASGVCHGK